MFCENCGKKIVRGYSFCMECGSPVPQGAFDDDENDNQIPETENQNSEEVLDPNAVVKAATNGSDEGDDGDLLVYCPNCGLHMQKSTDHCDKCGEMLLSTKVKSTVPIINNAPTDLNGDPDNGDIDGDGLIKINPSAITDMDYSMLEKQLKDFSETTGNMPTVEPPANQIRQKKPRNGEELVINNFNLGESEEPDEDITINPTPVITGGSMDEDPNEQIDLNPYKFLNHSMGEDIEDIKEEKSVEKQTEEIQPEPIAPVFTAPEIQPEAEGKPAEKQAEEVQPEPIAPVFTAPEIQPEAEEKPAEVQAEEIQPEPIAPVFTAPEIQPEAEEKPAEVQAEEVQPEPIAPVFTAPEIQPEAEEKPAEKQAEEVQPAAAAPVLVASEIPPKEEKKPEEKPEDDFIPEEMGFIAETPVEPAMIRIFSAEKTR